MPRLAVFLCPQAGDSGGARVRSRGVCPDDLPGLSRSGHAVTLRLAPDRPEAGQAVLRLLPRGESLYCAAGKASMRFGRAARESGSGAVTLLDELALSWRNPDHCHWTISAPLRSGGREEQPRRLSPLVAPGQAGGDCRQRPALPGGGERSLIRLTQAVAAPGELLSVAWRFEGGADGPVERVQAGGHLETPCLRGGRVVETAGEPGRVERRYLVRGHDDWFVCAASDHVPYAAGDWAFFSQCASLCLACRWWESRAVLRVDEDRGGAPPPPPEAPRPRPSLAAGQPPEAVILPLRCGGVQAASPRFVPLEPPAVTQHPMGDLLDFCLREGTVIQVNPGGTLDVEMPWGRETIPVHYHCPKATGTVGGHTAFQPEDEVLVVSTREQQRAHVVIGFADKKPRPCKEYLLIGCRFAHQGSAPRYLVWDPDLGGHAEDIPDGKGGFLRPADFPCTLDKLNYWVFTSRKIDPYDQMPDQILAGERVGHVDTVDQRLDSLPAPGRLGADLECEPPSGGCPVFPVQVNGRTLGGFQGERQTTKRHPNPHAGEDVATHRFNVECATVGEEGYVHEQRHWRAEIPWLTAPHTSAPPHPAPSLKLTWKGAAEGAPDWTDFVQASRVYTGEQHIHFSTDLVHNLVTFQEIVDDTVRFPNGATHTFHDLTASSRPVTGEGVKEWNWNDRYATVNAAGLRTGRVWCHLHVLYSTRWTVQPWATGSAGQKRVLGRDLHVAGGAGLASDHGLESNPFRLPDDVAFQDAIVWLIRAAEESGVYASSMSEFLITMEARA